MAVAMIFDILLDNNVFEYAKLSTECAYHLSKFFVLELYFVIHMLSSGISPVIIVSKELNVSLILSGNFSWWIYEII